MIHTSSIPASSIASSAPVAQGKRVGVLAATPAQREACRDALHTAELRPWTVKLQHDDPEQMLPPLDGPVVLDTRGYAPRTLLALLVALTETTVPILALVERSDLLARRLLTACPQIRAVVRALPSPEQLAAWTMAVAISDRRRADQAVAHLGIAAPSEAVTDVRQLVILEACFRWSLDGVALMTGIPRQTVNRRWQKLRRMLEVRKAEGRERPWDAAEKVLSALATRPDAAALAAMDVAQDAVVAEQEVQVLAEAAGIAAGDGFAAPTEERPMVDHDIGEQRVEVVALDMVDWSRLWPTSSRRSGRIPRSSPVYGGQDTGWHGSGHVHAQAMRASPDGRGSSVSPAGRWGADPPFLTWNGSWCPAMPTGNRSPHAGP